MGLNFIAACHTCKEQITLPRGDEGLSLMPFRKRHSKCITRDSNSFVVLDDQLQERDWMRPDGGYNVIHLADLGITNPTIESDRYFALERVKHKADSIPKWGLFSKEVLDKRDINNGPLE